MDLPTALREPLLVASCTVGAVWALYRCLLEIRNARLIGDTPLVRIRSAAQGYVKIFGRAHAAAPTAPMSPLARKPCVWWSYEVERRDRNRSIASWLTVESATSIEPFVLNDGDGECLVGPVCATVVPSTTNTWYGDEPWPQGPPGLYRTFLQSGAYRYTERRLDVGAELTVLGELRSHSEVGDIDSETSARLRDWKLDQAALLARFDADQNGRLSTAEWDAARLVAASEARAAMASTEITRLTVIEQPTQGEVFLIAPMDGECLVRRERWRAAGYFALGLAVIVLGSFVARLPWFD